MAEARASFKAHSLAMSRTENAVLRRHMRRSAGDRRRPPTRARERFQPLPRLPHPGPQHRIRFSPELEEALEVPRGARCVAFRVVPMREPFIRVSEVKHIVRESVNVGRGQIALINADLKPRQRSADRTRLARNHRARPPEISWGQNALVDAPHLEDAGGNRREVRRLRLICSWTTPPPIQTLSKSPQAGLAEGEPPTLLEACTLKSRPPKRAARNARPDRRAPVNDS